MIFFLILHNGERIVELEYDALDAVLVAGATNAPSGGNILRLMDMKCFYILMSLVAVTSRKTICGVSSIPTRRAIELENLLNPALRLQIGYKFVSCHYLHFGERCQLFT